MLYKKPVTIIVGAAFAAYQAGEHFRIVEPSPAQMLQIGIATSTSTASNVTLNFTTFTRLEPPPPVLPPNRKFEQS